MSKEKEIRKELRAIAPELLKIKASGFELPDDYFQQLPDQLFERIKTVEASSRNVTKPVSKLDVLIHRMQWLLQPQYALAALSIVLLIVSVFYLQPPASKATATSASLALEQEEIAQYVEENIEDFEETLLVSSVALDKTTNWEELLEEIELEELF
ncbi:MAG: hypothetical protein AAF847_10325 [Bacteroidota bacterium]